MLRRTDRIAVNAVGPCHHRNGLRIALQIKLSSGILNSVFVLEGVINSADVLRADRLADTKAFSAAVIPVNDLCHGVRDHPVCQVIIFTHGRRRRDRDTRVAHCLVDGIVFMVGIGHLDSRLLGMPEGFTVEIAKVIIDQYKDVYPELARNAEFTLEQLKLEEGRFARTLKQGEKEFEKVYQNVCQTRTMLESILAAEDGTALARELAASKKLRPSPDMMPIIEAAKAGDAAALEAAVRARMEGLSTMDGRSAFKLYDTYGFPIEMTRELAAEKGLSIDEADFAERFKKHQELSHQGADQKFKGGLADHSEQTARLHTATHLLHAALRKVLGDEVAQKGSNITAERLRFDFSFGRKMTPEELQEVERLVNEAIDAKVPVVCEEMTVPEAKAKGAIGLFESKYGERVRTYKMGDYSFEICGGPHAENTGDLGSFRILKEESSSAGVRRIKAIIQPKE